MRGPGRWGAALVAAAVLVLLAAPGRAAAQSGDEPRIEVAVEPGLGRTFLAGPVPVVVSVLNRGGQAFEGRIELACTRGGPDHVTTHSLTLQPGQARRVILYPVFSAYYEERWLRVVDSGGRLCSFPPGGGRPARVSLDDFETRGPYGNPGAIVAAVDPSGSSFSFLQDFASGSSTSTSYNSYGYSTPSLGSPPTTLTVASVAEDELPDRWYGYVSFDLLVLAGVDFEVLPSDVRAAILDWVRLAGGHLLLVPGGAGFPRRTIDDLLGPVEITMEDVATPQRDVELQLLPQAAGVTRQAPLPFFTVTGSGLESLTKYGTTPLIYRASVGAGQVDVMAFDPRHPALGGTGQGAALWRNYVSLLYPYSGHAPRTMRTGYYEASGVLRALDPKTRPSPLTIACLVGLYVASVGPGSFYLLRRRRREILMVFAVPLVAAVFSAAFVFTGYVANGVTSGTRTLSVIWLQEGERAGLEETYAGIFPAVSRSFDVETAPARMLLPVYASDWEARGNSFTVDDARAPSLPTFHLPQWELGVVMAQGERELGGPILFDERTGTVDNRSGYALRFGWATNAGGRRWVLDAPIPSGATTRLTPLSSGERLDVALGVEAGSFEADVVHLLVPSYVGSGMAPEEFIGVLDTTPEGVTVEDGSLRSDASIVLVRVSPAGARNDEASYYDSYDPYGYYGGY